MELTISYPGIRRRHRPMPALGSGPSPAFSVPINDGENNERPGGVCAGRGRSRSPRTRRGSRHPRIGYVPCGVSSERCRRIAYRRSGHAATAQRNHLFPTRRTLVQLQAIRCVIPMRDSLTKRCRPGARGAKSEGRSSTIALRPSPFALRMQRSSKSLCTRDGLKHQAVHPLDPRQPLKNTACMAGAARLIPLQKYV